MPALSGILKSLRFGKHNNVIYFWCLLPIMTVWFSLKYIQRARRWFLANHRDCFVVSFATFQPTVTRFGLKLVWLVPNVTKLGLFTSTMSTYWLDEQTILRLSGTYIHTHTSKVKPFICLYRVEMFWLRISARSPKYTVTQCFQITMHLAGHYRA